MKGSYAKLFVAYTLTTILLTFFPARASAETLTLNFSYADGNGTVDGNGDFTVTPISGSPDVFALLSGNLTIKAPAADGIAGIYNLISNPNSNPAAASYSSSGLFIYDNQLTTNPGVFGGAFVTNPGILVGNSSGTEINLFSVGANTYNLYKGSGGSYPYSFAFSTAGGSSGSSAGTMSVRMTTGVVAAPEPAAWAVMVGFLGLALFSLRRFKKGLPA